MKAITLHQPFASLVANGTKTIETRSWAPPPKLIGQRIAIHAASNRGPQVRANCIDLTPDAAHAEIEEYAGRAGHVITMWGEAPGPYYARPLLPQGYPLGEVVATAVLADAGRVEERDTRGVRIKSTMRGGTIWQASDSYGDFSLGRWLWFLERIELVDPPIPAKGRQGFWEWTP